MTIHTKTEYTVRCNNKLNYFAYGVNSTPCNMEMLVTENSDAARIADCDGTARCSFCRKQQRREKAKQEGAAKLKAERDAIEQHATTRRAMHLHTGTQR